MKRNILLLTAFAFLTRVSAKTTKPEPSELQKFLIATELYYKAHGLNKIRDDLKRAWTEIMDGHKHSLSDMSDLQKFLRKVVEDYNVGLEKNADMNLEDAWENYITVFGKKYTAQEKEMRKGIFKKSKERMANHNKLFKQGRVAYSIKLNHLSDRTHEELEKMKGFRPHNLTQNPKGHNAARQYNYNPDSEVPPSIDWRTMDYVTPVKFQGACSSCYAFAGIGALEAYHKKKEVYLINLSVQNILDCTWNLGNNGCSGGSTDSIFEYAKKQGVESHEQYPYTMNASHICKWKMEHAVATDKNYYSVPIKDEMALKHAIANHGPVAAGIGASEDFYSYGDGVFLPPKCGLVAHSVLIVGYGRDSSRGEYWIAKNSYGEWWGESGYIRIARNKNNLCDVASHAIFLAE